MARKVVSIQKALTVVIQHKAIGIAAKESQEADSRQGVKAWYGYKTHYIVIVLAVDKEDYDNTTSVKWENHHKDPAYKQNLWKQLFVCSIPS